MYGKRTHDWSAREGISIAHSDPIIIEAIKPMEMYQKGDFAVHLNEMLHGAPKIKVRAFVLGKGIVTITNETITGHFSVVSGKSKSQLDDGDEVFFDQDTIDELERRGFKLDSLKERPPEFKPDTTGVREIQKEIMDSIPDHTLPPPPKARFK